jgi:transcriptional regulator with XRE-family HTH domain
MLALMQGITSQGTTGGHSEYQVLPSDFSDATFARRLRLVREAAGMTQQQLADAMAATGNKIHRSTIGKIESGDRPVTIGEAVQLAGIVGVPLEVLATDLPDDAWERIAYSNRVKANVRLRSLQHEASERHKVMEEARLLYEDTLRRLKRAEQAVAALGGELAGLPGEDDQ